MEGINTELAIWKMVNSKLLVGWSLPCVSRVLLGMTVMSTFDIHILSTLTPLLPQLPTYM